MISGELGRKLKTQKREYKKLVGEDRRKEKTLF